MVHRGGSYAEHSNMARPPFLFIANNVRCPSALQLWSAGALRVDIRAHFDSVFRMIGCSSGVAKARLSKGKLYLYTNVQPELP